MVADALSPYAIKAVLGQLDPLPRFAQLEERSGSMRRSRPLATSLNLQHDLTSIQASAQPHGHKWWAPNTPSPAPIEVEPLSPGAAAVILLRANLKLYGEKNDAVGPLVSAGPLDRGALSGG